MVSRIPGKMPICSSSVHGELTTFINLSVGVRPSFVQCLVNPFMMA
jgi:hypothetical protein